MYIFSKSNLIKFFFVKSSLYLEIDRSKILYYFKKYMFVGH